jgi:hypothetical protein
MNAGSVGRNPAPAFERRDLHHDSRRTAPKAERNDLCPAAPARNTSGAAAGRQRTESQPEKTLSSTSAGDLLRLLPGIFLREAASRVKLPAILAPEATKHDFGASCGSSRLSHDPAVPFPSWNPKSGIERNACEALRNPECDGLLLTAPDVRLCGRGAIPEARESGVGVGSGTSLPNCCKHLEEWRPAHIEKWVDRKTHGASGRICPLRLRREEQAVLRRGDG